MQRWWQRRPQRPRNKFWRWQKLIIQLNERCRTLLLAWNCHAKQHTQKKKKKKKKAANQIEQNGTNKSLLFSNQVEWGLLPVIWLMSKRIKSENQVSTVIVVEHAFYIVSNSLRPVDSVDSVRSVNSVRIEFVLLQQVHARVFRFKP